MIVIKVLSFNDPSANCSPFIPDFLSGLWSAACCGLRSGARAGAGERLRLRERETELGRVKRREGWGSCQSSHSPDINQHGEMEMTWINVITENCPDLSSLLHIPHSVFTKISMSDLIASLNFWRQ